LGIYDCLILTSPTVVRDLLVERGSIFSSRLEFEVLGRVMLRMGGIGATPYDDRWRLHRKIANSFLAPRALDKFNHVIDEEGINFVKAIWKESQSGLVNPIPHCARYPLNSMLYILYGWRTQGINDPIVKRAMELGEGFAEITGILQNAVDFLPWLRYLPNKNVVKAQKLHEAFIETWGGLIENNGKLLDKGEGNAGALSAILWESYKEGKMDWTDVCMFSTGIMLAGIETTAGTIAWLIAILSKRPDLQAKAHAEIDSVIGNNRLPDFSDESSLPYIRALLKETLRYRNPFPQGIPHMSTEDQVYNGYFIPKNTIAMINVWGIHFDENKFPNPELFDPERYINDTTNALESANLPDADARDHFAFGAGRRICVGTSLAEREMFLAISRFLWAFRIIPRPVEKQINLEAYSGELPRTPVEYEIEIVPRHANVGDLLEQA